MAGSISDFRASFTSDIARPSRFDVQIPVPLTLTPYLNSARNLSLRCESAQLPSRTFVTTEQKFGSNPTQKFPYHTSYNDAQMTFIVSDDMSEKLFFDAWMEYINPSYSFDFNFKSDYATTIIVNQYDVQNNLTYSINLIDAYPVSVNQLDLDWSSDNQHKLVVDFAYTYWQNNSIQALGSSILQYGISQIAAGIGGLGPAGSPSSFNSPLVTSPVEPVAVAYPVNMNSGIPLAAGSGLNNSVRDAGGTNTGGSGIPGEGSSVTLYGTYATE